MDKIRAHLLPFSVGKEEHINAKDYFRITKEEDGYETALFGRKLVGQLIHTSRSTEGHIYTKEEEEIDDMDDMEYMDEDEKSSVWKKRETTIDEFILWKKDTAPSQHDPRKIALKNWIDLSKSIHEVIHLD
ncbi:hypothetical protein BDB01DRAFT_892625 [Pilobolus umbonatus]|nr:hypothetical protein BDB01DRAFT_892625 [Pilobolus umbonatus]